MVARTIYIGHPECAIPMIEWKKKFQIHNRLFISNGKLKGSSLDIRITPSRIGNKWKVSVNFKATIPTFVLKYEIDRRFSYWN